MDNTIEELKNENAVLNRRLNALISVLYPTCLSKDDLCFIDEQGEKGSEGVDLKTFKVSNQEPLSNKGIKDILGISEGGE